jgi:flagellar hook assembly protein FlgD
VAGQVVKTMEGHLDAGEHRLTWDGRSSQGQPVASGTYFFQAQAGAFNETRRMTLLK